MPRLNRENIDRKTNKPNPTSTDSLYDDMILNRAEQNRRDDDVIRTPKRTSYDIDYAIKWFVDNEIRPQVQSNKTTITIPTIWANGEKWDNVRRLGYLRDEKGMLQSPLIMLKRNSITERDSVKTLDVNRPQSENVRIYKSKYNERNRYEDTFFPMPTNTPASSEKIYIADIPKYVTIEYDMMIWCDFTTQLNSVIDQIMPYGRFAWGNETNKFTTTIGSINFETMNTTGEDRIVRATIPLTVLGTLLSEQEVRRSTLRKMYSVKQLTFDQSVDVDVDLFSTTVVPQQLLRLASTGVSIAVSGATTATLTAQAMAYLTTLTDQQATYINSTTVTINAYAAINPVTFLVATKNEFDVYINGQYIDKQLYTWTPSDVATQTIVFDTAMLGYPIDSTDAVIINGRWA
jgi:hypothetical protein